MRKFVITLSVLAGVTMAAAVQPAAAAPPSGAAVQTVQHYGYDGHGWRHHSAWVRWHRPHHWHHWHRF